MDFTADINQEDQDPIELEETVVAPALSRETHPIGVVLDIAGSGSRIRLSKSAIAELSSETDFSFAMAGQIGSLIKIRVAARWVVANIRSLSTIEGNEDQISAAIDFMGEGDEERLTGRIFNFRRGATRFPSPGDEVHPATTHDMQQLYAADNRPHVEIGNVYPTRDIRAALYFDAMLGKHFALLGSTGTGKSTSAALILHRIIEAAPEGHIVMIDPHGEYGAAFKNTGELFDVTNLAMPYWLMNFEEHCEVFVNSDGPNRQMDADVLAKCLLAARQKSRAAEGITKLTVDSPIPYLLSDLTSMIMNEMGKLDKATDSGPFMRLKSKIDEIKADPRYSFMFSGMLVADSMADFVAKIFRLPSYGKPISIIDVSAVPNEITSVVVAMLSRMVFDFALWSRDEPDRPILLVCEEAHRYIPASNSGGGQAVRKILERIAKEGRKYGVSLGLITQRPSDLAEGVLSQCGTIISMRLNNERDQMFVKAAMPEGARGFLDSIPALRNRECIICGEGVNIPVRVTLDDLEENKRPDSTDPSFAKLWQRTGEEDDIIRRTIIRWRTQGR